MRNYAIMHLNESAAIISETGLCTISRPDLLPYNLHLDTSHNDCIDVRTWNLANFHHWCSARLLALDRKYAKEILNSLGLKQAITDKERAEIAISYHALSLTDVYWIRETQESVCFEDINLYDHPMSDVFAGVSLCGQALSIEKIQTLSQYDIAGDLSTLGIAPKAWLHRNKGFLLLKGGSPKEVEAELLASQFARCFDIDQVLYEPLEYEGQQVSQCKLITSKEQGIVSARLVSVYAENHGSSLYDIIEKHDSYNFHMMNIIDYLVGNTDRHLENWGFWVNNKTNSLETLHPLMDFNHAFHAYDTIDGALCQTTRKPISQKDAAIIGVQTVGFRMIHNFPGNLSSQFRKANALFEMPLDIMFQKRLALLKTNSRQ